MQSARGWERGRREFDIEQIPYPHPSETSLLSSLDSKWTDMHEKMMDNPHIRTTPHGVTLDGHLFLYHNELPAFDPWLPLVSCHALPFCGEFVFFSIKILEVQETKGRMADAVRREENMIHIHTHKGLCDTLVLHAHMPRQYLCMIIRLHASAHSVPLHVTNILTIHV